MRTLRNINIFNQVALDAEFTRLSAEWSDFDPATLHDCLN